MFMGYGGEGSLIGYGCGVSSLLCAMGAMETACDSERACCGCNEEQKSEATVGKIFNKARKYVENELGKEGYDMHELQQFMILYSKSMAASSSPDEGAYRALEIMRDSMMKQATEVINIGRKILKESLKYYMKSELDAKERGINSDISEWDKSYLYNVSVLLKDVQKDDLFNEKLRANMLWRRDGNIISLFLQPAAIYMKATIAISANNMSRLVECEGLVEKYIQRVARLNSTVWAYCRLRPVYNSTFKSRLAREHRYEPMSAVCDNLLEKYNAKESK